MKSLKRQAWVKRPTGPISQVFKHLLLVGTIQLGDLANLCEKIGDEQRTIDASDLLNEKYILVQKGKKNYHLVTAE